MIIKSLSWVGPTMSTDDFHSRFRSLPQTHNRLCAICPLPPPRLSHSRKFDEPSPMQ
jgi:hypothetical protein